MPGEGGTSWCEYMKICTHVSYVDVTPLGLRGEEGDAEGGNILVRVHTDMYACLLSSRNSTRAVRRGKRCRGGASWCEYIQICVPCSLF